MTSADSTIHEALRDIDTEAIISANITAEKILTYFKLLLKQYRATDAKFKRSGQHNSQDFWEYCDGNTDVMYLHVMLIKSKNTSFVGFCSEGNVLSHGLDTVANSLPTSPAMATASSDITPGSSGKKQKASDDAQVSEAVKDFWV